MKILAGQFKNHAIESSQKFEYRPTTSIARKSIPKFKKVLPKAYAKALKELNKKHMNQIITNAKAIPYNHFSFLVRDVHRFLKKSVQYDIIFADPPYHISNINKLIELCLDKLNPGGVFVLECSKKESIAGYNKISKFGGTNLLYWQV